MPGKYTMKINRYTFLAFQLNHAIDVGDSLDVRKMKASLEDGSIFEYVSKNTNPRFDTSIYTDAERLVLITELLDLSHTEIDHKFGVEHNGLCVLMAYLLELIQRKAHNG